MHLHIYTHKHDGQNFIAEKSKKIHNKFVELREKTSQSASSVDESQLFYDTVGGHKKRKIFGLRSDGVHYYGQTLRPSSSSQNHSDAHFNFEQVPTPGLQEMLQDTIMGMIPDLKATLKEELLQELRQVPHANYPQMVVNASTNQSQTSQCAPNPAQEIENAQGDND